MNKNNIDTLNGYNFPINSKEQKKVVDILESLDMNIRTSQLIKRMTFSIKDMIELKNELEDS